MLRGADARQRRGAAVAELAVLLPFLVLLFVLPVDFCRIFYYTIAVENCARNGALWAGDSFAQSESPYQNVTEAARADFPAASQGELAVSSPVVVVTYDGVSYAQVTCIYQFQTLTNYPGVGGPWTIQRVARARVVPPR
jgi:Flp pilus assembly protein TadG